MQPLPADEGGPAQAPQTDDDTGAYRDEDLTRELAALLPPQPPATPRGTY